MHVTFTLTTYLHIVSDQVHPNSYNSLMVLTCFNKSLNPATLQKVLSNGLRKLTEFKVMPPRFMHNLQVLKDLLLGARYHITLSDVLWSPRLTYPILFRWFECYSSLLFNTIIIYVMCYQCLLKCSRVFQILLQQ